MKNYGGVLMLVIGLIGGYLLAERTCKQEPIVITKTKTDTIRVAYADTIYAFKTRIKEHVERDTVLLTDTVVVNDTVYVAYYSPFRVGSDSLNCSGIVNFDMKKFTFENIKFQYPQRTITKIQIVRKPDWTYTAIGTALGIVIGVSLK